jgi:hypothetical protein
MIVDFDIFQGEINIGQLESPGVQATVKLFIEKYEPVFLREQLGDKLAAKLIDGLSQQPTEEKWNILANMFKYPAAKYIYCKYMRNETTETSGQGAVQTQADTAIRVSPWDKIVRAWNEMVDDTQYLSHKLHNSTIFPEYCQKKKYRKINPFGI